MRWQRLPRSFFRQGALALAEALIGKLLVRCTPQQEIAVRIVETEAYIGPEDKGCHAFANKRTRRTEVMFGPGGHAYIYLIYGMYHCLNVVAGAEGNPEAVLIRAAEPVRGLEAIRQNRPIKSKRVTDLTNGPGKLCQALAIDKTLNGCDMIGGSRLFVADDGQFSGEIARSKRINIDYAEEYRDKLWRFLALDSEFVSVPPQE